MSNFGERLRELRIEKGLSQAKLAKLTGLSQPSIAMWELQGRSPTAEPIIILARFFGVTSDYLLGLED